MANESGGFKGKVRKKSSARSQGSPSMPSQRPAARQRQERVATRSYRPPSSATRQGSPSVPQARSFVRRNKENAATRQYVAQDRKKRVAATKKRNAANKSKHDQLRASIAFRRGWNRDTGSFADRKLRDLFGSRENVERANFEGYYDRLWNKTKGYYPKGADKPELKYEPDTPQNRRMAGYVVTNDRDTVHITPGTYMGAHLRPSDRKMLRTFQKNPHPAAKRASAEIGDRRNFNRSVPLHEWGHSFQKGNEHKSKAEVEGGAEALAQQIAKDLKRPYKTPTKKYRAYTRSVKKRKGSKYIRESQFEG